LPLQGQKEVVVFTASTSASRSLRDQIVRGSFSCCPLPGRGGVHGLSCTGWRKTTTTDLEEGRFRYLPVFRTSIRRQGGLRVRALIVLAAVSTKKPMNYSTAMVNYARCGVYISSGEKRPKEGETQAVE